MKASGEKEWIYKIRQIFKNRARERTKSDRMQTEDSICMDLRILHQLLSGKRVLDIPLL